MSGLQLQSVRATPAIWPMSENEPFPLFKWSMLRVNW